ncbi:response regulator [Eubacterium aggregans]|uniref:response regulator n=1 Tax=Eubacterium aggregans TaxID=81409 RepID=UPI003F2B4153
MLRIAICDDEVYFLDVLERQLVEYLNATQQIYEIDRFASVERLFETALTGKSFAILFMDIEMPGINGIETVKK